MVDEPDYGDDLGADDFDARFCEECGRPLAEDEGVGSELCPYCEDLP